MLYLCRLVLTLMISSTLATANTYANSEEEQLELALQRLEQISLRDSDSAAGIKKLEQLFDKRIKQAEKENLDLEQSKKKLQHYFAKSQKDLARTNKKLERPSVIRRITRKLRQFDPNLTEEMVRDNYRKMAQADEFESAKLKALEELEVAGSYTQFLKNSKNNLLKELKKDDPRIDWGLTLKGIGLFLLVPLTIWGVVALFAMGGVLAISWGIVGIVLAVHFLFEALEFAWET